MSVRVFSKKAISHHMRQESAQELIYPGAVQPRSFQERFANLFFVLTIVFGVLSLCLVGALVAVVVTRRKCEVADALPPSESFIPITQPVNGTIGGAAAADSAGVHLGTEYYRYRDCYNQRSNANLTIISGFKTYQQTSEYSCGPACALMMMHHFGVEVGEDELVKEAGTVPVIGTSTEGMVKLFEKRKFKVETSAERKNGTFGDMREFREFALKHLAQGHPIAVDSVEWGGHWMVIIGYDTMGTDTMDDDVIIFADPYDTTDHVHDGITVLSAERFYSAWFSRPGTFPTVEFEQYVVAWKDTDAN